MARVRIPIAVIDPAGNAVAGASVNVQKRSSGTAATLYQAETGPTTVSNPTTTDSFGRIQAWVDRGSYNAIISGTGLTTYTQPFDAAAAGDLTVDSAWLLPSDFVTVLPASPSNGQECYFVADAANGVVWHLKYHASSSSAYKWEYIGGTYLLATVETAESSAATAFGDLATVGPSITVPLAGDYEVRFGSLSSNSGAQANIHGLAVGATAAADTFSSRGGGVAAVQSSSVRTRRLTALAAATALVSKYRVTASTGTWEQRWLAVVPIRVG